MCVEIDLDKPLVASYRIRGRKGQFQYEGLQDLCFSCGKYGHREVKCPLTQPKSPTSAEKGEDVEMDRGETSRPTKQSERRGGFGPWMVAQKPRRRQPMAQKGISGTQQDKAGINEYADKGNTTKWKEDITARSTRGFGGNGLRRFNHHAAKNPVVTIASDAGGCSANQVGKLGSRFDVLAGGF